MRRGKWRCSIMHRGWNWQGEINHIFHEGLIEETLNILALLFPSSDKDTETWFHKTSNLLSNSIRLDKKVIQCGELRAERRQIGNFYFWHDRLVVVKQVFERSRPATIGQWWYDRRNSVQWCTFWVAFLVLFLTIVFGLTQCVLSGLQVYKAYHPTCL
ncbi:hypothetical protein K469DRAFT_793359 [Zopfia rhizophila CBS 207.26]|uniref:Uncharacterized protein n=1 Tax=Zopfia rhizophila CBS 207.26 TaxID=1314779 RepID=A0A6A6DMX7_9PEZI|nr:hypothetical protein K469DRAFT_793359 [Zopfia rhizophila CBS 207.26]